MSALAFWLAAGVGAAGFVAALLAILGLAVEIVRAKDTTRGGGSVYCRQFIERTREQDVAIEALSFEHGTIEIVMTRSTAGDLAHVHCEDGFHAYIDTRGAVRSGRYGTPPRALA